MMIINSLNEVDFAKTLEMANTRFLSRVSGLKIDANHGMTKFYQLLMKYETDIDDDIIQSFKFQYNPVKQPELVITADMITNFNTLVETVGSIYYSKSELEDKNQNPTAVQKHLRKELAKKYLPQLDYDEMDEIIKTVNELAGSDELQKKVDSIDISKEDLKQVDNEQ